MNLSIARFETLERIAVERKLDLRALGPEEIEALWQEVLVCRSIT